MSRQIPLNALFNSNSLNAYRDPIKQNRFHFKLPNEFILNNSRNDKIVGITSLYITKGFRFIDFILKVKQLRILRDPSTPSTEEVLKEDLIRVRKFFDDSILLKDLVISINEEFNLLKDIHVLVNGNKPIQLMHSFFEYSNHESVFVIKSPFNEYTEDDRTVNNYLYSVEFDFESINDDFKNVINYNDKEVRPNKTKPIITKNIWDRNSCILYSSLAQGVDDDYLGHTRKYPLIPIKYFRLKGYNDEFWVDLYATVDHKAPVYLPADDKDALYIEAILLDTTEPLL